MGTGYVRNDTSGNIANGKVIDATDLDGEFDAIVTAFSTSGHTHDGTAAEGGKVTKLLGTSLTLGDGTVGKNAFLQSVDNITGLRESGKAPALDNLYEFGSNMYNLFNQPSTPNLDITALGGPRAKGNFTKGKINVEDYSTKVARIQAKKEAEARARAQAQAQAQAAIQQRQQQQSQKQQQSQLPAINTSSNITKFGPTRSTAIKGGRGGRGNVGARKKAASAPVFKSYGPPNMQRF